MSRAMKALGYLVPFVLAIVLSVALLAALAGALRIEITFEHPVDTRMQLEVLAAAIIHQN